MPSYENNAYYHPENIGATLIAEFEVTEPNYSFDTVILVRKDDDNTFYMAHDEGCSCPVPFEDIEFPEAFTRVRTLDDVKEFVKPYVEGRSSYYSVRDPSRFYEVAKEALR